MNLFEVLPKPFLILAPMDDVTDTVFRQIVADCAKPDLFFSEFVNVDGLQSPGRQHLLHKLKLSKKEGPVIAQLWGLKPDNFYKTTKELIEMGFAGVDLNMGCPVKTVIKNGACSALINNHQLAGEIVHATREAAGDSLPVSVKTRVGFTTFDESWINFLLKQKLDLLSIHARTVKQMSKTPAQWKYMEKIRALRDELSPATKLVGNGDVMSRFQAEELAQQYMLDGIMVGRGIFHDPFLFEKESPWGSWNKQQKLDLFARHIKLYQETYGGKERRFDALKKFCKVYINGFDGAAELRAKFMETGNTDQALALLTGSIHGSSQATLKE